MSAAHSSIKPVLPKVAYGKGCSVFDTTGKRYIDGSGGPAVYCLGHSHPEVNQAIIDQLEKIAHGYRYTFTSDPWEELSLLLKEFCGGTLHHGVFVSSGSEANESCMKIALQYHSARNEKSRRKFVARQRSYHGNTLGALSVSGFQARREPFEGSLLDVHFISAVNAYRPPIGVHPEQLAEYAANELAEAIEKIGPEKVAAFMFEPIVGAAGGVVPSPPGYASLIRKVCNRYGILMIADEVMCGAGRCGTWRALEQDGVEPDILSVAKGLAGGYVPLGAALYTENVRAQILQRYENVQTGHTFTSHTLACAAGAAVQRIIKRDKLLNKIKEDGIYLRNILHQALGHLPYVGDIRGRGFFWGIEFVRDRDKKQPFDSSLKVYERIKQRTLENGLICYPNGGNIDGISGDHVLLAPPYIASRDELDEIVVKLQRSVADVMAQVYR